MINGYIRPQIFIREVLQKLPNIDQVSLHAFVFGPQFDLFRYYVAAERANMKGAAFVKNTSTSDSARQVVPFEGLKTNHVVDSSFVRLFGENLEGCAWTASSPTSSTPTAPYSFRLPNLASSNQVLVTLRGAKIEVNPSSAVDTNGHAQMATVTILYAGAGYTPNATLVVPVIDPTGVNPGQGAVVQLTVASDGTVASGIVIASGSGYTASSAIIMDAPSAPNSANVGADANGGTANLIPDLRGRPITAGDVLYVTCNSLTYRRIVQSVIQQVQPPAIGTNGSGVFAAAATNPLETDSFAFQNAAAPAGWGVDLAATSLIGAIVSSGGSGYTTSSVVTISAPHVVNTGLSGAGVAAWAATQAAASVILNGSAISGLQITEPGTGYFDGGVILIPVSAGGSGYTIAPTVAIGLPNDTVNGLQATAIAHIAAGAVTAIEIIDPGAGYSAPPSVTLVGGNGSSATVGTATVAAAPTISVSIGSSATITAKVHSLVSDWNGLIQGSTYQNKYGERYTITCTTSGTTAALFRIRSASGAFSADNVSATYRGNIFTINDASLGGLAVDLYAQNGQGMALGNQFSFVIIGKYVPLTLAPSGQVIAVNILNSGTGYSSNNAITFVAPPTGGRIAKGKVATVSGGAITGITITDPGTGYVYPPAVSAIAGGTGALLQAVISSPSNSCDIAVVPGSTYNGTVSTRYIVEVVTGSSGGSQNSFTGAVVKVSDVAGIDTTAEITVAHGVIYNLGSFGLQFTFPSNIVTPSGLTGTTATAPGSNAFTVDGGGAITSVAISNPGAGYVVPPTITITTSGGSGAVLQAVLNNGILEDIIVVSGGSGYSTSDTYTVAAPVVYQAGLRTGDIYYLDVTAPVAGGAYNTIVLKGQATDISGWAPTDVLVNLLNIDNRVLYTGEILTQGDPADAPNLAWAVGASGILVKNNLKINVSSRNTGYQWLLVQNSTYAKLFASWRGLVPATGTNAARANQVRYPSKASIISTFGVDDLDNPVSYGACRALDGAQSKSVYASSLPTNDLAGYTTVLNQAAKVQGPYALAPMTEDANVLQLVKTHVDSCSLFNKRLWRRAYVATESPGKYGVYTKQADGSSLQASILTNGSANVRVVAPGALFIDEEVQPGDVLRTFFVPDSWGNMSYQEFPIFEVLENTELVLTTGPNAPVSPAIRFEIWRPDTAASQVEFVGNVSEAFDDRRIINVWCEDPVIFNTVTGQFQVTPVYYIAAEIAGLRSALLPQQGLTLTQLQYSLSAAPSMYTKYSEDDLSLAASHGVLVINQDVATGTPYIFHQLTTDTVDGSLYYEDSIGTNFDNIAYLMKQEFSAYIGKRNATPQVIEELDVRMRRILDDQKKAPADFSNIGPAIVDYSNLFIQLDPNFRDRINIQVTLTFALPLNVIDMTLTATVIQGDVSNITLLSTQSPTS